jgi:hypothetical protein
VNCEGWAAGLRLGWKQIAAFCLCLLPFDNPSSLKENHLADDMRNSPKLLIDTNILVAATRNRLGPSFALMQLVRSEKVTMCCSPAGNVPGSGVSY